MDSASAISPSSDASFWISLRDRVDTILDDRQPDLTSPSTREAGSERGKRFREDSQLLIRGLDSVASSLSQLTDTLSAAKQGVGDLATKLSQKESQRPNEDVLPKAKRHHGSSDLLDNHNRVDSTIPEDVGLDELPGSNKVAGSSELKEDAVIVGNAVKSENLKKAKNLAITMGRKAASLATELKMIKPELSFMKDRCALLEEENRRLREGLEKGDRPEEDDLVRLQLEALLAEKSRLANDNANLTRENQCLHQLVEYHQLTSQELMSSYEELASQGLCLDFSSPLGQIDSDSEGEREFDLAEMPCTPTGKLEFTFVDEHCEG